MRSNIQLIVYLGKVGMPLASLMVRQGMPGLVKLAEILFRQERLMKHSQGSSSNPISLYMPSKSGVMGSRRTREALQGVSRQKYFLEAHAA